LFQGPAKKRKKENSKMHCIKKEPVENLIPKVKKDLETMNSHCLKSFPHVHNNSSVEQETDSDDHVLKDYFQLDIKLEEMYKSWSKADQHFSKISKEFTGIRMLRQDPVECLFSFICSSNNNISRITSMVDKLAKHYGRKILVSNCVDGEEFYTFPKVEALAAEGVEDNLRKLGFGYRAKYIQVCLHLYYNHN
jgi:N-glycosylase/DNA lyase